MLLTLPSLLQIREPQLGHEWNCSGAARYENHNPVGKFRSARGSIYQREKADKNCDQARHQRNVIIRRGVIKFAAGPFDIGGAALRVAVRRHWPLGRSQLKVKLSAGSL